eukprot:6207169-Pleurochrysis_carterae.AAC.3
MHAPETSLAENPACNRTCAPCTRRLIPATSCKIKRSSKYGAATAQSGETLFERLKMSVSIHQAMRPELTKHPSARRRVRSACGAACSGGPSVAVRAPRACAAHETLHGVPVGGADHGRLDEHLQE